MATTTVSTPRKSQPPRQVTPPQPLSPPTFRNSPSTSTTPNSRIIPSFRTRAATLQSLYSDFKRYIESIQLLQSRGQTLTDAEYSALLTKIENGERLSNNYWELIHDIIRQIRSFHQNHDAEPTLVLGYSSEKIVIECPYCSDLHEHKRVADPGIGIPLIYPAACGASGLFYRAVFPGDIDKLTSKTGKDAVGIQIHKSGAYWMAVIDEIQNLDEFFVVKFRPRKTLPLESKAIELENETKVKDEPKEPDDPKNVEKIIYDRFIRLNLTEDWRYNPVKSAPTKYFSTIRLLQSIAQACITNLNSLDKTLGFHTIPDYNVKVERSKIKEVKRETRSQVEHEIDLQTCTISEGARTRNLAVVKSDGYRTVCSCIRGPNYTDLSLVSGLVEAERVAPESDLALNNKQLQLLVQQLALEIGHTFPDDIPSSASYVWKRELERKNKTAASAAHWYACHAEKKMLVRFLIMHTTWTPEGFNNNIFHNRNLLGKEAGARTGACLMKNIKFWVSWNICEDCENFIAAVSRKFDLSLSFHSMESVTQPRKSGDSDSDSGKESEDQSEKGKSTAKD
ncbi:hypothetical protein H072_648 [Dactylellina haptotyla CBS 200.50]|uniref:Uncharacterized protein n=1 Tax=Dactylellina haptotyla (strain CBS 200.50) TaxID=1284197 RepID=S8C0Z7_DACHA|nr:hypothetical protein H072_648 [Dactylellina haptotyla CBS 200.50]